ncbi:pentatricopeptide repeat-containing family protein [Striga asiatica]|uniref:Pentatricopeptide repeat-containing family protein n=1 Tax=Striga asiatica TaxID=4170 RepID=A0A5A7REL5_STRAF|nr:pentatricopeptide repeat-containing family protein [Striga asiatica]
MTLGRRTFFPSSLSSSSRTRHIHLQQPPPRQKPIPVFKFPKLLHKRLYSFSPQADSKSSYLNRRIDSFLFGNFLDTKTLLPTHAFIVGATGNARNKFIASYASVGRPYCFSKVFDSLHVRDAFLWNSIIKAQFSNGGYAGTVELFSRIKRAGNLPDQFSFPMVVSACAELGSMDTGMAVHGLVSKANLFVGNSAGGALFVYMYAKCGSVENASLLFDEIPLKDVVAWTALVIGYVQNGESEKGLLCLKEMHRIGGDDTERLNSRTFEGGFRACAESSDLTAGSAEDVKVSFDEVVEKDLYSWTSIIVNYARLGRFCKCFEMFNRMQADGVHPDGMGKRSMGISCGAITVLTRLFGLVNISGKIFFAGGHDQEKESWNIMVVGYQKAGLEVDCINLFKEMQFRGIESDSSSLMSLIFSCSRLGSIPFGQSVNCHIIKQQRSFENVSVVNSLMNMYVAYAENGKFFEAITFFDKMISQGLKPNLVTVITLLSACARFASLVGMCEMWRNRHGERNLQLHDRKRCRVLERDDFRLWGPLGRIESVIEIFRQMEENGTEPPNRLSFLAVLSACAHSGLVEEGKSLFDRMMRYCSLVPTLKHYACMVDLYEILFSCAHVEALCLYGGSLWTSGLS